MGQSPVVRLRDVTKSYGEGAGKTNVLRGVSFDIDKGELIAKVQEKGVVSYGIQDRDLLETPEEGETEVEEPDFESGGGSEEG